MTDPTSDRGEDGREEAQQDPPSRGEGREIVDRAGDTAAPIERLPDAPEQQPTSPSVDDQATKFLSGLLTRTPFHDYFCRVAMRTHTEDTFEHRVQLMKQEHPRWHALCVVLDMSLRIVVTVLLVAAGAAIAYKTLFPLPFPGLASG